MALLLTLHRRYGLFVNTSRNTNPLKPIFKNLLNSSFARNVAIVASGTVGAQVISMAFAPIITRLYGPEAFGLLGTFLAILAILTPIAALTYPIAIVLPKSDYDAVNLAKLSACLAFGIAGTVTLILLCFGHWIAQRLNLEAIAPFLLFIPLAMLFSAFHEILQQWLIRKKQFGITARIAVLQSLIINFSKAGFGLIYPFAAVLIVLSVCGNAVYALMLWVGIRTNSTTLPLCNQIEDKANESKSIKELAKRHCDFPLYRAPQVMLNAVSQSLPTLLLASFFGPAAAGFYTLAKIVMGVPAALVGKAVGDVFYPRIADASQRNEDLSTLIIKATLSLAFVGFMPFSIVIVFGPWLFSVVFGAEWVTSGEYSRWLAMWFFFGFVNKPSVAAVPAIEEQPWLFFYELFSTGAKVIALGLGFYFYENDQVAIALFAISGVMAYIYLILRTISKARTYQNAKAS